MLTDRNFVSKNWGWEDWIVNEQYCGKVMFVKQKRQCSFHYHKLKTETFYVQSGELLVRYFEPHLIRTAGNKWLSHDRIRELYFRDTNASFVAADANGTPNVIATQSNFVPTLHKELVLRAGDSFHLPVGMLHQFHALLDTTLIEFSTHHEDSDSYRVVLSDGSLPVETVEDAAKTLTEFANAKILRMPIVVGRNESDVA